MFRYVRVFSYAHGAGVGLDGVHGAAPHNVQGYLVHTKRLPSSPTEGPMWGHPMPVLGALSPLLEPFCGHLSPKIDKFSEELTLRYPHEGPWVARRLSDAAT